MVGGARAPQSLEPLLWHIIEVVPKACPQPGRRTMAGGVRKEVRVVVMGMSIEPVAEAREAGGTEPSCAVHTWGPAPPLQRYSLRKLLWLHILDSK